MKAKLVGLLLALTLFLPSCTFTSTPPPTPEPTFTPLPTPIVGENEEEEEPLLAEGELCTLDGTLTLGAVESLSGPAAVYGATIRKGIELAVEEVNAQKFISPNAELRVIFEDDESDREKAAELFLKLIREDKVLGILGPTLSNSAFSADPLAQAESVPVIGTSNTAAGITEMGNYIFRNSLPEADVIPNTIDVARAKMTINTVVILYGDDDRFTQSGYEAMANAAELQGLEILATATFTQEDTDFSEQLEQVQELDPDAILVSALVNEAAAILVQMEEMGIDKPVIGGNGFNSVTLLEEAGEAAEGVIAGAAWFIENPYDENVAFVEAYRAKYDEEPDQFAAQAYTGLWLFAHGLQRACSTNRGNIRNALADLRLIKTPLGVFGFTTDRNPLHPPVVLTVEDGKYTLFKE